MKLSGFVPLLFFVTSFIDLALAQDGIITKRVQFASGKSSSTMKGTLKGDEIRDYVLGAKAGQTMRVTLKTNNGAGQTLGGAKVTFKCKADEKCCFDAVMGSGTCVAATGVCL